MIYIITTVVLFIAMLVYFKIADKYNIIDKPNHRSAHTEITLRGGGIIFPIAFLMFLGFQIYHAELLMDVENYFIFGIGLLTICTISFIDDMMDLSSKIRLIFHFISVSLLLYFLNIFQLLPFWAIPICYIMIIGTLNAYNFMDGINGMSGIYTLVVLGSLWYVNQYVIMFTDVDFIIYPMLAALVFLFFNFRKKAKCFLGDIGSMAIAFWVLALLGLLMLETREIKWILFLTVYGIEVIFTIIQRLKLKENIFEAHRHHLYQLFANDLKVDHRLVSLGYSICQIIISFAIIAMNLNDFYTLMLIVPASSFFYLFLKLKIKKQIETS
ncbi:MraY family glycosyltransferase [Frigoriflavimonas asaccharolytica]|uniref:UDP-N-acetylmuramyl pentapeptide phosphotransferase/UDP-N-acetylglucosamine-1-phosphate transferase n=1 Tax=Frigoriflavimonas asaccharolytica TaxID=2735899 RepID=A0A8J8G5N6_9FLAO|nr:glycosyltransferase family 4 protein [Frigoriflavimonas asaccharolytica]NRS91706.1 UDP-N-acetylmuramyl pentapeptide phosphotransferase/UDP-N-acetylglucosamine-1-phosphate transferase [Frigoriflavimonas asaccharolytica]